MQILEEKQQLNPGINKFPSVNPILNVKMYPICVVSQKLCHKQCFIPGRYHDVPWDERLLPPPSWVSDRWLVACGYIWSSDRNFLAVERQVETS